VFSATNVHADAVRIEPNSRSKSPHTTHHILITAKPESRS